MLEGERPTFLAACSNKTLYWNHAHRQNAADRVVRKTQCEDVAKNALEVMIWYYRNYYDFGLELEKVAQELFHGPSKSVLLAHINQVLQNYHDTIEEWHMTFHVPFGKMPTDVSSPFLPRNHT